ncbi:MAG: GLPGLI family protein, partial [Bacteroidetes bacterium]|nr:GLPGLI family protein [Bacteroidota bacterium]
LIQNIIFGQINENQIAFSKVKYKIRYGADTIKDDKADLADYVLLFNNKNSVFYSEESFNFYDFIDKKAMEMKNSGGANLGNMPKAPRYKTAFTKVGDELYAYMPIGRYIFSYKEPPLKWEILDERKKIKNYDCILAKTTTDTDNVFYAWFTPQISVSEGPFRFKGLPGLIIEIFNERKTIKIFANEIEKSSAQIVNIKFPKVVALEERKDKFLKAREQFIIDPNQQYDDSNIRIYDTNTGKELKSKLKTNPNMTSKDLLD